MSDLYLATVHLGWENRSVIAELRQKAQEGYRIASIVAAKEYVHYTLIQDDTSSEPAVASVPAQSDEIAAATQRYQDAQHWYADAKAAVWTAQEEARRARAARTAAFNEVQRASGGRPVVMVPR